MAVFFNLTTYAINGEEDYIIIGKGKQVSFNYTLAVDGEIVDTSKGRGPFRYTHGESGIIPGLAKGLEGMKAGEKKTIGVLPEEAYGKANPAAFQEVQKSRLSPDIKPEVGMALQIQNPGGRVMPVRIAEIKDNSIVVDVNHPLAGKTLVFEVEIVSVN